MAFETDQKKKALMQKSAAHRAGFEEDVKILSEKSEKVLTNLLIIGGALTLSYLIVRQFGSSGSEEKRSSKKHAAVTTDNEDEDTERPSKVAAVLSGIGSVLATQATAYLLALAKEKLLEYLDAQTEKKKPVQNDYS